MLLGIMGLRLLHIDMFQGLYVGCRFCSRVLYPWTHTELTKIQPDEVPYWALL